MPENPSRDAGANQRRVVAATIVGITIEWYDFFIYATAAGLVFAQLFFEPAGPRSRCSWPSPPSASPSSSAPSGPSWPAISVTGSAAGPSWSSPCS